MQVCKVVRLSLSPILATHVSTSFSPLHSLRLPAGASLSIYIDIHIYIYIYIVLSAYLLLVSLASEHNTWRW